MPGNKKCCASSSSSSSSSSCSTSSSSSEECYKVKCKPPCKKKDCCFEECPCYTPQEIGCKFGNAVVGVQAEYILLGTGVGGATATTALAADTRADIILNGNGFFIKGHYIICPAQLVLLPPSLTSVANRFPFFDATNLTLGQMKDQMICASRILVTVYNVNNKNCSYVYEAGLIGVDGAGDIAVLKIKNCSSWNQPQNACPGNPCVKPCHPYFKFGKSKALDNGEKVYLIGDFISSLYDQRALNANCAVVAGNVADHRYVDYAGWQLPETVLVNAPAYSFTSGLPILDCQGRVVGMQTADLAAVLPHAITQEQGAGYVAGPSEYFMRRVVKSIIKGFCPRKPNCQLEVICDPVGSYIRYKKGYLGLAYDVFVGGYYDVTTDYTSGTGPLGEPRIRLDANGNFLDSPVCKSVAGIRVLGVAGLNPLGTTGIANGFYYVPGGTGAAPLPSFLPNSPLLGKVVPGDLIVSMNGCPLGDAKGQIAPSLVTWRTCANEQVSICYRKGGNALNSADNSATENYATNYSLSSCLADYPYLMDYPWYAVNVFPLLSAAPYPGFTFPTGQCVNPQVPQLTIGSNGLFHPAI